MAKKKQSPKTALVLSGGSARGLAHLGVISVLEEKRIPVDFILAASYGSIVGAYYADGFTVPEMFAMARAFRLRYVLNFSKPWNGILSNGKVESILQRDLKDRRIEDLEIPLSIQVADIRNGSMDLLEKGPLTTAILGSCAFPGLLRPVEYEGRLLIDGGILNKRMVGAARSKGADIVIYSDVCVFSLMNRKKKEFALRIAQRIFRIKEGKESHSIPYAARRALQIISTKDERNPYGAKPPDFLIEPLSREIRPLRYSKVDEGFHLGREAALKIAGPLQAAVKTSS